MTGVVQIFQKIADNKNNNYETSLAATDEYLFADITQAEAGTIVQSISSLLSKAKTRLKGIHIFNKCWRYLAVQMEEKISMWTVLLLKACNSKELEFYGNLIYDTLGIFVVISQQSTDLSKNFATNHLNKIYSAIITAPASNKISALKCAETCLRLYPAASAAGSKVSFDGFLKELIDTNDEELNSYVGHCHYLLRPLRSGSKGASNSKEEIKLYQLQLLENLHILLDQSFEKSDDLYHRASVGESVLVMDFPVLKLSNEPLARSTEIFIRFRNLVDYLKIAICEPSPMMNKPVMAKRIIDLVVRGLGVTSASLNENKTYDHITLGLFLPDIQARLLDLLQGLIQTLRGNLRMYHEIILGCLIHVLQSTSLVTNRTLENPLHKIRTKAFYLIGFWCKILHAGSRCEIIANDLVTEIFKDLIQVKKDITLQVVHNDNKAISKKKSQKNTMRSGRTAMSSNDARLLNKSSQKLCMAGIFCLQELISSSLTFLQPNTVKLLQINILKICSSMATIKKDSIYSDWRCRLQIYKTLHILLSSPHHICPPPLQVALFFLNTAQRDDDSLEIRIFCGKSAISIEKLIHPQKESLLFQSEFKDFKNTYLADLFNKQATATNDVISGESPEESQHAEKETTLIMEENIEQADTDTSVDSLDQITKEIDNDKEKPVEFSDNEFEEIEEEAAMNLHKRNSKHNKDEEEILDPTKDPNSHKRNSSSLKTSKENKDEEEIENHIKDTSSHKRNSSVLQSSKLNTVLSPKKPKTEKNNQNMFNTESSEDLLMADIESAFVDEVIQ